MKNFNLFKRIHVVRWLCLVAILYANVAISNNLRITNVKLIGAGATRQVQFDIAWDNSWRTGIPNNWDAAWVFFKVKYQNDWVDLHLTGNEIIVPPEAAYTLPSDKKGIFIYRNNNGTGNIAFTKVSAGVNIQPVVGSVDIKSFGLEMVYIPAGPFYAGGGGASGFNATYIHSANAAQTTPSDLIMVSLAQTLNNNYPNGYNPFYCMKYEITQQQYVDFLNCLPRSEQINRVRSDISGTSVTNRSVMSLDNSNTTTQIRCNSVLPAAPTPVNFYCDWDNDGIGGENNDGQWRACVMRWDDLQSILSWSGLRPMTELEYEKVCRGPLSPLPGEYAWGTTNYTLATNVQNPGTNAEIVSPPNANYSALSPNLRVGSFAGAATNREQAGAAYYGAMNMSGNLWEHVVNIYAYYYFDGYPLDVDILPAPDLPLPIGLKGGSMSLGGNVDMTNATVSDREFIIMRDDFYLQTGGRGVKSVP